MSTPDNEEYALSPKRVKTGGRQKGTPNKEQRFELGATARLYGLRAITTIVEIMEDEEEVASVRLQAAKEVLDRGFGKAKSVVEVGGIDGDDIQHKLTIEFIGQLPTSHTTIEKQIANDGSGRVIENVTESVRTPQPTTPWGTSFVDKG